jgi:hypothetical protein
MTTGVKLHVQKSSRVGCCLLFLLGLGLGTWFLFVHSVNQARYSARRLNGISHAKILCLSLHNYASGHSGRLPSEDAGKPPRSWRTKILQYLGRTDLEKQYRDDAPWDAEPNTTLSHEHDSVWQIPNGQPARQDQSGRFLTDFGLITGPGTAFPPGGSVSLDEIAQMDGLGQTLMLGECSGLRIVWTEPRDPDVSREQIGIEVLTKPGQTSNQLLSGYFTDGVVTGFADGAARFLSKNIDPKVLKALTTIDGQEPITQEDYLR